MGRVLFVLALLFSVCMLTKAQGPGDVDESSGSGSGSGSGNGSGNGTETCDDLQCSHGCNEATEEDPAVCYCPIGYSLALDMRTCQPCPGGLYGINCETACDCGETGNTCDRMSGMCECNPCYSGEHCEEESGSSCFVQFLGVEDKSVGTLRGFYGMVYYPVPPMDRLQTIAADLMDTDADLISDVTFNPIDRSDVGQGPLVQLSWIVDKSLNPVRANEALSTLSDKVKLGEIRATYIAQDSTDTTLVTLNSGVKDDPI